MVCLRFIFLTAPWVQGAVLVLQGVYFLTARPGTETRFLFYEGFFLFFLFLNFVGDQDLCSAKSWSGL